MNNIEDNKIEQNRSEEISRLIKRSEENKSEENRTEQMSRMKNGSEE